MACRLRSLNMFMLVAVICGLLRTSQGYPQYWVGGQAGFSPACDQHPTESLFPIATRPDAPHRTVQPDASTSITLLKADGTPVTPSAGLCPGQTYQLQLSWPQPGPPYLFYVTTSLGQLAAADPNDPQGCKNRFFVSLSGFTNKWSSNLTLPCDAQGQLEVKVTASYPTGGSVLHQTTQTTTISTSCAASSCGSSGGGSGTAQQPKPPAQSPPQPSSASGGGIATNPSPPPPASRSATDATTTGLNNPSTNGTNSGTCGTSELGYDCAITAGRVRIHWTLGGSMPNNTCTGAAAGSSTRSGSVTSGAGIVHMAVTSTVGGWVGLSFPRTPLTMAPADSIIGLFDNANNPSLNQYYLSQQDTPSAADKQAWAAFSSIARTGGQTIVCFTRALKENRAMVSSSLNTANVGLNWAVSGSNSIGIMHDDQGGLTLNMETGAATLVDSKTLEHIKTHGVLMTIGWVGLLPLGTLLPRHRWALGETKVFGKHLWFQLHLLFQISGFAIMTAGIACAWNWFEDSEVLDNGTGSAHKVLGVITFAGACLQVVGGFARPDVNSPSRPMFNVFHHWLGRLAVVLAWVTIYLGIVVFHKSSYPMQLASWIGPIAAVMGAIVLLDVTLTIIAYRSNKPLGAGAAPAALGTSTSAAPGQLSMTAPSLVAKPAAASSASSSTTSIVDPEAQVPVKQV